MNIKQINLKRIALLVPLLLIASGILLRILLWWQNRNLIIDEANIVRNLSERGFRELLQPLKYEQYAPPVFLWFEKLNSLLFGYGEKASRLYPLICGIISLFVFYGVVRRLLPRMVLWYPLALFCWVPLLVHYAVEVKQYVPDTLVTMALVLMALHYDVLTMPRKKFAAIWIIGGSIAIWTSQPSVFVLAGIGFYYFIRLLQNKQLKHTGLLAGIAIIWFLQFAVYFKVILVSQIGSDYLQTYHHDYFLNLNPKNKEEWQHNWLRLKELLSNTGGWGTWERYTNGILFLTGGFALLLRYPARFALICGPVILTLLAAATQNFSLIDRVSLFLLPFNMIILGYGLAELFRLPLRGVQYVFALACFHALYIHNFFSLLRGERYEFHELTKGFEYVIRKGGNGRELYVDCASGPTFDYYTRLHPDRARWSALLGAHVFKWSDDNYPEIARNIRTPHTYFIFTGGNPAERDRRMKEVRNYLQQTDYFQHATCYVFQFGPAAPRH